MAFVAYRVWNVFWDGKNDRERGILMKMQLTKLEKSWILYDIANSAFILLVATLLPIYFDYLAGNANLSQSEYLAYWGGYQEKH